MSTTGEFPVVQKEGERMINRRILHYNLDMVISVGYRVKSKRATLFRKRATGILKDFAIKGYALNQSKITYEKQLQLIRMLERTSDQIESKEILNILEQYTLRCC